MLPIHESRRRTNKNFLECSALSHSCINIVLGPQCFYLQKTHVDIIGVATGPCPPKFLACTVILCLKMRYPKQNSVLHLKSNMFGPPKILG